MKSKAAGEAVSGQRYHLGLLESLFTYQTFFFSQLKNKKLSPQA